MKSIKVYTPAELSKKYPEAFDKAHNNWNGESDYIPWADETIESLKAIVKSSGLSMKEWTLGPDDSHIRIDHFDAEDLEGQRAIAWIENNLLHDLRTPYGLNNIKDRVNYHYKAGSIPDCPLTGYCADIDLMEALHKEIMEGSTLREAYTNLGYVVSHLLEQELKYQQSDEYFIEQDHLLFTCDGVLI